MRNFTRTTLLLLIAALGVPSAVAQAKPTTQATPDAKEKQSETQPAAQPINSYKLDYLIYELEDGKRINSRNYTLLLTDRKPDNSGQVRTGSRIPVETGSLQSGGAIKYLDVGVSVSATLELRDGRLFLQSTIDTSGTAPEQANERAPIIRQIYARGLDRAVTLGKAMLLTSLDDAVSKRSYQVEVTVTRL